MNLIRTSERMIGKKETVFAEGAVFVKQPRTFSCRERFYNDPSRANSDIRQKRWCGTFTFRSFFHSNLIATKHSSIVRARTKISFEDVSEKKKKKNSNNDSHGTVGERGEKIEGYSDQVWHQKCCFIRTMDRTLGQNQWRGEV